MIGDMVISGKKFTPLPGMPPMTGFGPLLTDREIAGVLTYVRNNFKNRGLTVKPETVARIRKETAERQNFYTVEELLKDHPLGNKNNKKKK